MGRHPMDDSGRLDAAAVAAAFGVRQIGANQFGDLPVGPPDHLVATDDVGVAQPHMGARGQPLPLRRRRCGEVLPVDVEQRPERQAAPAQLRTARMPRGFQGFAGAGVVGYAHPQGIDHAHALGRGFLQVPTDAELQQLHLHLVVLLGDPNAAAEVADGLGPHAASPQPRQARHARVVPALHQAFADQPLQQPFAHHPVFQP